MAHSFIFVLSSSSNKDTYCGVMKSWQTCPLVSGVGITGQTKSRADVTIGKADQG